MNITEIRIKIASRNELSVLAYAAVALDDVLVLHDIKLIRGDNGEPFMSMPSRMVRDRCGKCHAKNPVRYRYCGHCGYDMGEADTSGKIFQDVCHPIDDNFRVKMRDAILRAYYKEKEASESPNYDREWGIWSMRGVPA